MVTTGYVERDIRAGDVKLHYQEWGHPGASPVLMLHGFGVSGHMFDEFAQRMQDRYRLIALDQRGHGDSDWSPDGDYTREAFVADIESFRQSLGLERFVLVGHSMGGLNAVTYAVRHPERVKSLVLVDVGPEAAREGVDNIARFTRGPDELEFDQFVEMAHRFNPRRTIENIRERMRTRLRPLENGKWTWKFDKRFRQEGNGLRIGSELTNDETWQLFRQVQVPTLLVRGGESDVLTQEVAQRTVTEMPLARLVVVPGAGHSVPGDSPDEFTAAVREFLGDAEAGRLEGAGGELQQPPPLREAVEYEQAAGGRRRGSLLTLVLLGAGLVVALAGFTYLIQSRRRRRPRKGARAQARKAASRVIAPIKIPAVDLDVARKRARDLALELGRLGQQGAGRARTAASEVDFEPARRAALDVVRVLGTKSREAPAAAIHALESVDRNRMKRRGKRAASRGRSLSGAVLQAALAAAPWVVAQLTRGQKKKRRKGRLSLKGWRR